eukprot:SAG31_NODE_40732_length_279_cov_0.855556_1_plen_21_part_10
MWTLVATAAAVLAAAVQAASP